MNANVVVTSWWHQFSDNSIMLGIFVHVNIVFGHWFSGIEDLKNVEGASLIENL